MYPIKLCLDHDSFSTKPQADVIKGISTRISGCPIQINNRAELEDFIKKVSTQGYTFCPATFSDNHRCQQNFVQEQLIAMDFDNDKPGKTVTFDEIKNRADYYDLHPLFAYHSLRSTPDHPKFRLLFLNDVSISDPRVAKAMQLAIGEIFPEADPSCYSDVSKMYFGGKELIYYDETIPMIDIDTIFCNLHHCIKKNYGEKHYKEKIRRFSKKTGISLTKKGFFNVSKSDEPDKSAHLTEGTGASSLIKNGGNSPSTIIMYNRIGDGENPPFCTINFNDRGTSNPSVGVDSPESHSDNHRQHRSSIIKSIRQCCLLYREFEDGERSLQHDESYHLLCNLIFVESGSSRFINIMSKYPELYDKVWKWANDVKRIEETQESPTTCDRYCPHCKECNHARNILTTAHPIRNLMEPDPNCDIKYYSLEEAQDDAYDVIHEAYMQNDNRIHIIKAQVGIGKSHSYLRIMEENPGKRFLIAAPTNLLKNELYKKAKAMGSNVCVTPSLEEIKDKIPTKVWKKIQWLYKRGQHCSVALCLKNALENEDIPCLKKYMEQKERVKRSKGCLITTHRYMLTMEEQRLNEFDSIIVDEDVIFKSIVTNQGEITLSALKKLGQNTSDPKLHRKIKELLTQAEMKSCVELVPFEYDIEEDTIVNNDKKSAPLDIPSFCAAKYFYIRRAKNERNLKEDTVSFLKPSTLKDRKHIIVSATADEDVCCQFFGMDRTTFHECKQATYKGKLLQYPDKSMSRSSIDNDKGIVRRLMKHFNLDESHVITFMREDIGFLHFGNTEGSNALEGQAILVVGTPYHADFLYKLIAFTLGYEFDEDEEMTPQVICRNGYRVRLNTYKNENLRKVHLWMMDSELDQAAGRARLLRHDCTVHLFSRFPMKQAEIVKGFAYSMD